MSDEAECRVVHEGCWRTADGFVYRWNPDGREPFQFWSPSSAAWVTTYAMGPRPHTPCDDPSKPEWRDGRAAMHWMLDREHKEVETREGARWRCVDGCFEALGARAVWRPAMVQLSCAASARPVEGTW